MGEKIIKEEDMRWKKKQLQRVRRIILKKREEVKAKIKRERMSCRRRQDRR